MATQTSKLVLRKPDPHPTTGDFINTQQDLNDNWDKIDAAIGAVTCTSSTRPATPYEGMFIRETDTNKMYCCAADATPGPVVWTQVMFGTASFDGGFNSLGGPISIERASGTDEAFRAKVTGQSNQTLIIDVTGRHYFGPGTGVVDANFYRVAAAQIGTDHSFYVGSGLTVNGAAAILGGLNLTGNFKIGSATYRNKLSSTVTIANTTTETVLATLNIPANDAVAGAIYRITVKGSGGVTGTPTFTWRGRIGGVGGGNFAGTGAVTASSGVTNKTWEAEMYWVCLTAGAGGTARGMLTVREALSVAGATPSVMTVRGDGTTSGPFDTTASLDLVLTGQWSTASASNSLSAWIACCERVA